ncbi:MAG TPA: hypothetical protein VF794_05480 [Archangium sp.]|uniref:hypothetical protein n=1 Tax=Archangium sp. TaxID=1872627 RepID=UPI002ED9085C
MKFHRSSRSTLLLTLGLLLAPAARAETELIALHPCNIVGAKGKQLEELQASCSTQVARDDVQLVSSELVRAFLDKEPKKSCVGNKKLNECLGRLAAATQASRALLITIDPGQLTRISGLVVDSKGELVDQKNIQMRSRGQPSEELARGITRLIEQLNLVSLKLTPLVEQQPTPQAPVVTPPPAQPSGPATGTARTEPSPRPAPPEATQVARSAPASGNGRSWKTPAAYAGAGVGVVGLGLAGVFAITGNNAIAESNTYYQGGLPTLDQLSQVSELREKATTHRTIAGVSAAVGAALVGTGVYLWLNDRPASPAPGAAALSAGPGGVSIHVLLP